MLIKLVLVAIAAYAVWHFWRRIGKPYRRDGATGVSEGRQAVDGIEDMTQCALCRSWVAASAPACGRQDCPRRN
jgi:hypothetical protein